MPQPGPGAIRAAVGVHEGGATIALRARPGAAHTAVTGRRGSALTVDVAAPPVDGAANAELCAHIAEVLGVAASDVRLLRGDRRRDKVVLVAGLDRRLVMARLLVAARRA